MWAGHIARDAQPARDAARELALAAPISPRSSTTSLARSCRANDAPMRRVSSALWLLRINSLSPPSWRASVRAEWAKAACNQARERADEHPLEQVERRGDEQHDLSVLSTAGMMAVPMPTMASTGMP